MTQPPIEPTDPPAVDMPVAPTPEPTPAMPVAPTPEPTPAMPVAPTPEPAGQLPPPPAPIFPAPGTAYAAAPETPTGTDGFAIASLIFAIIGGVLFGLIFGFVALSRIKRSGASGRGLAIAGIVISAVWIVVGIILVIVVVVAGRASNAAIDNGDGTTSISVFDLKVGDCALKAKEASGTDSTTVKRVTVVACTSAHDVEAYSSGTLPDGPWVSEAAVTAATETECVNAFEGYVGIPYADSSLGVTYLFPQEAGWNSGDRSFICFVGDDNAKTAGSLKGAAR